MATKIELMALAIRDHEGWFPGSRSQRNHNPGNLRLTPYTRQLGALDRDKGGFAIFADDEAGMQALIQLITDAARGKLQSYRPEDTLYAFFAAYAPATDHNKPLQYAELVAQKVGVDPHTQLKDLL